MQSLKEIKVVSWDVDGTLYDSRALRPAVARRIAGALASGRWKSARLAGKALREHKATDRRVRTSGGEVDAEALAFWNGPLWSAFMDDFMLPALKELGPRPGLVKLLSDIASSGRAQVVVSDFDAERKLQALGVAPFFPRVFSGTRLGVLKPHPRVMSSVLAQLGVAGGAVVHVGDRLDTDDAAARGAGMASVHLGELSAVRTALQI